MKKPYMKTSAGLQMLRDNKQYVKLINGSSNLVAVNL
jgi:hypothetical protein